MLRIRAGGKTGKPDFCDGIARRDFISIGAMGIGGLTMANLLELEANASVGSSHKAVINLFLPGGPPLPRCVEVELPSSHSFPPLRSRSLPRQT